MVGNKSSVKPFQKTLSKRNSKLLDDDEAIKDSSTSVKLCAFESKQFASFHTFLIINLLQFF